MAFTFLVLEGVSEEPAPNLPPQLAPRLKVKLFCSLLPYCSNHIFSYLLVHF